MSIQFNSPSLDEIPFLYPDDSRLADSEFAFFVNGQEPYLSLISEKLIQVINTFAGAILVDGGANYFAKLLKLNPNKLTIAPFCCAGDFDSIENHTLEYLKKLYPQMRTYKFIHHKDYTDLEGALKLVDFTKVKATIFNALGGRIDQMLGNLLYLFRIDYQENVRIFSPKGSIAVFADMKEEKNWVALPFYEDDTGACLHIENPGMAFIPNFPLEGIYDYTFDPNHIIEDLKLIMHCTKYPGKLQIQTPNELFFIIPEEEGIQLTEVKGKTISLIPIGGPVYGVTTSGLHWELDHVTITKDFISMSNIAIADTVNIFVKDGSLLCIINEY